ALGRYLPILEWGLHYKSEDLVGDVTAGIIVASVLVPQSMAYAQLAGLPPQSGLYASILPLLIYPWFGTSRFLAVGPEAVGSLLVAAGLTSLSSPDSPNYLALAAVLALGVGIVEIILGLLRLGFVTNFLSHAVTAGFINAAALVIGFSQVKHILGVQIAGGEHFFPLLGELARALPQLNPAAVALGVGSGVIILGFQTWLAPWLRRRGLSPVAVVPIAKSAPLLAIAIGTLLTWRWRLNDTAGIKVVGDIPAGLPTFQWPNLSLVSWQEVLPVVLTIAFVGFTEAFAVAQALGSRRRQSVDANQELIALGAANLGAAFTGAYPVTGGVSRSALNFTAGANTSLALMITGTLMALTVMFLTPLFYFLPQACLAAMIMVAVSHFLDWPGFYKLWRYNKADAIAFLATFITVLVVGVVAGILTGAAVSIVLYLWRTSRPHIAIVGRIAGTEHFRNVQRHPVLTCPHVLSVRVDESLYFANMRALEDFLLTAVTQNPEVKHLVLICSGINFIDGSALETLERLMAQLQSMGVQLNLAEVKGPVMDGLEKIGFVEHLGREHIFLSTHAAMEAMGCSDP
ncbi:MAG TPA: sulfate permease, partial [Leptolyngbyaceae cyanobacterium M65_K2018_010]|nr:sulfate permease [Leptolyngbyaceae cyanobacterium M65_K2018_010]